MFISKYDIDAATTSAYTCTSKRPQNTAEQYLTLHERVRNQNAGARRWVDSSGSRYEEVVGSCEHGNDLSGSIKRRNLLIAWGTVSARWRAVDMRPSTAFLLLCHRARQFDRTLHTEKSNKMQQCIKIYYCIFTWSSTCFGRHTAHHQEPETALAAYGLHNTVESCWTCACWTLSCRVILCLTASSNHTSNNLPQYYANHRLIVQFQAPDGGRCVARNMLSFILCMTASSNHTSNNLPRYYANHRLLVQFQAPDGGRCVAPNMLSFI